MRKTITRIIFVCTGNTCRSPMAEVLAKKIVRNKTLEILSRGIFVPFPAEANKYAKQVVMKYQLSLEEHRAKAFSLKEVTATTLVLTMTEQHKYTLLSQYPQLSEQVMTLYEVLNKRGDIHDPYGMPVEVYEQCFDHLSEIIQETMTKLEEIQ